MALDIKEIIRKKRQGGEALPAEWRGLLLEIFKEWFKTKEPELNKIFDEKVKTLVDKLGPETIKELKPIVLANMPPPPKDGHTPTEEELLALIEPLIPEVEDGKDADETRIVERAVKLIPKPQDGKSPTKKALKALMKPLFQEYEEKLVKRVNTAIKGLRGKLGGPVKQGGGMGNWTHQVFEISSATTSVTLNSRVAAGGNAILVRYQGQLLAHGVQYTSPGTGKNLPLLFTPADNTYLEVTFVRT